MQRRHRWSTPSRDGELLARLRRLSCQPGPVAGTALRAGKRRGMATSRDRQRRPGDARCRLNPTELGGDSAASEKSLRREGQVHCGCPAQRLSERLKAALIGAKVARALWVADGGPPSTGGTSASRTVSGRLRGNVDRLGALGRVRAPKRPWRGGQRDHDDDGGAFIARGLRNRYWHHKHSTRGYCRVPATRT